MDFSDDDSSLDDKPVFKKRTKLVEPYIKKEVMDSPSRMFSDSEDSEDKSDVEEPKPIFEKKTVKDSPSRMYFSDSEDKNDVKELIKVTVRIQKDLDPHSLPSEMSVAVVKSCPIIKKSVTPTTVPRQGFVPSTAPRRCFVTPIATKTNRLYTTSKKARKNNKEANILIDKARSFDFKWMKIYLYFW